MIENNIHIGGLTLKVLSDGILEFDPCVFFPSTNEDDWIPHKSHLNHNSNVVFELSCYLIESQSHTILIDTGMGPNPNVQDPNFPELSNAWGIFDKSLANNHINPKDVDHVVFTHAHRDHIGWATIGSGETITPMFPNATYWLNEKDWDATFDETISNRFPNASTKLWPLKDFDQLKFFDESTVIVPEITLIPSPGHSPGHYCILIQSEDNGVLIPGDLLHNIAQFENFEWISRADIEPNDTIQSRKTVFELIVNKGLIVAGSHFASGFGTLDYIEHRYQWRSVDL